MNKKYKNENNDSSAEVAFAKIKEMLYKGEIVPGQKLLYHDLAKRLNMSVTPIAQALKKMEFLNLVSWERNKGYRVGEVSYTEVKELFSAREALEVYIVPEVIKKLSKTKIELIIDAMNEHINGVGLPQFRHFLMIKDLNFHLKIIECAENKIIYNTSRWIFEQICLKYTSELMLEGRPKEASKEHKMILKSISKGDVGKTKRLITQHIRRGRAHILSSFKLSRAEFVELEDYES